MTEEDNDNRKLTNKNNEQDTIESDIEQEDSICSGDKSNATTDDEFYNELMSGPPQYQDHLILDGCQDETQGIEHLAACLNRRYNACPVICTGPLKDAIKEAFGSKEIKERRPLLIYINNDKSVYSNLFCKQLLCNEKIVEYLLTNYVLWTWDVTFPSNGETLNQIFKNVFSQWNADQHIGTKDIEKYPLLFSVYHDRTGDYAFKYLIEGSNKQPNVDEFLARLLQAKDLFDDSEEEYERREKTSFNLTDFDMRKKIFSDNDYSRSTPMNTDRNFPYSPSTFARVFSNDHHYHQQFHRNNNRNLLSDMFQQIRIDPDDGDDEDDDDDDDNEQTPTVDHPSLKFPKQ